MPKCRNESDSVQPGQEDPARAHGKAAETRSPAGNVRAQPGNVEELRLVGQLLQEVQIVLAEGFEPDVAISQVVQDEPLRAEG